MSELTADELERVRAALEQQVHVLEDRLEDLNREVDHAHQAWRLALAAQRGALNGLELTRSAIEKLTPTETLETAP